MKTSSTVLMTLAVSSLVALSAPAQPPSKRTAPRPPAPAEAPSERPETTRRTDEQLTCATMMVPNPSNPKKPYRTVVCTPEMLENDPRCQQACDRS